MTRATVMFTRSYSADLDVLGAGRASLDELENQLRSEAAAAGLDIQITPGRIRTPPSPLSDTYRIVAKVPLPPFFGTARRAAWYLQQAYFACPAALAGSFEVLSVQAHGWPHRLLRDLAGYTGGIIGLLYIIAIARRLSL